MTPRLRLWPLFLLLWSPPSLYCFAPRYTQLSGLILDPSGAGVPEATISVTHEDTGFRRVTEARLDGAYVVSSLEPGVYKVTVRKAGFRTMIRFGVQLQAAAPARVDFKLAVGSMQEVITVEGDAAPLDRDDASVSTVVPRDQIERLPLNGRGLLSLLELAPGTVVTPATRGEAGQFTANGQRPNANYFTVDGVSVNTGVSAGGLPAQSTGGALPGMTAFGSLHGLISLDALEEFRVQTSTEVPEFGRLPGAQVALTSRSGSNEFHGSLSYLFRHEDLAAADWFANSQRIAPPPLRLNDAGASFGGPLRRNRTFFFLAYEAMRMRQPGVWRAPVPSLAARGTASVGVQPILNLFPLPNGPALGPQLAQWTGGNTRPSRLDVGSFRLDQVITSRITAFARYNRSPSANEFGSAQIGQLDLDAASLTLGLNLRLSPELVLDARANASRASADSLWRQAAANLPPCYLEPAIAYVLRSPGHCDYLVRFSIAGVGDIISGHEGIQKQSQFQFAQTATLNRSAHSLRLGFDYLRLSPSRRDPTGAVSVIAESLDALDSGSNVWKGNALPQYASSVLKEFSVFAQDTWRITPRFTATYGVRWEFSSLAVPAQDAFYLDPANDVVVQERRPVWPQSYTNFAPRLAFAYRPAAHTVIRAGAGLYYDSSVSIATDIVNNGPFGILTSTSDKYGLFSSLLSFGFAPDLRLPLVVNWSASVEHAFTGRDLVSAAYVTSAGRHLLRREMGGAGSSLRDWVALATNHGAADYHGLQLEYRRRMARGVEGRVSYAWSHSIDNSSTDSLLHWAGPGVTPAADRGSSDFDVRHALTAAFTYETAHGPAGGMAARLLRNWAFDGIFRARTGFPFTVLDSNYYAGLSFTNVFRPNVVSGQPIWIPDRFVPAGRRLNPAAFQAAPDLVQGVLGRNALSGFGMSQLDLAVRRELPLGERKSLLVRLEAYNALNQANFADPVPFLVNPLFGQSASMLNLMLGTGSPGSGLAPMFQTGGARSLQIVLRLRF